MFAKAACLSVSPAAADEGAAADGQSSLRLGGRGSGAGWGPRGAAAGQCLSHTQTYLLYINTLRPNTVMGKYTKECVRC